MDTSVEEQDDDSPSDDDEDSDYLSFDEDNRENVEVSEEERMARERERQMVLEAAGLLIVQSADDPSGPPPPPPPRRVLARKRSKVAGRGKQQATNEAREPEKPALPPLVTVVEDDRTADVESPAKRRPPPARPVRRRPTRRLSSDKDLPPLPPPDDVSMPPVDHVTQLDDAYARFEAFRNSQMQQQDSIANNRLSVISTDSTMTNSSPTTSFTLVPMPDGGSPNRSDAASIASKDDGHQSHRHSRFLHLLRAKTPEPASNEESQGSRRLTISGPMPLGSHIGPPTTLGSPVPASPLLSSTASVLSLPSVGLSVSNPGDELSPSRNHSPGFGTVRPSWPCHRNLATEWLTD